MAKQANSEAECFHIVGSWLDGLCKMRRPAHPVGEAIAIRVEELKAFTDKGT